MPQGTIAIVQTWVDKDRQMWLVMPPCRLPEWSLAPPVQVDSPYSSDSHRYDVNLQCPARSVCDPSALLLGRKKLPRRLNSQGQKRSDQQIFVADGLVLTQILNAALVADTPVVNDIGAVAQAQGDVLVLLGQQH